MGRTSVCDKSRPEIIKKTTSEIAPLLFMGVIMTIGKNFLIGVLVGAAAASLIKTSTFRKGVAKVAAAGLQLKEEAFEFLESVKEDAEDVAAEKVSKKTAAKKN